MVFRNELTREEGGCCLCSARLSGLREELEVLGFKQGAEGGEAAGGESAKERVRHCFLFWKNGALRYSYLRQVILTERVDEKNLIFDELTRAREALSAFQAPRNH